MPVTRYHPALVALHWLLGALIILQLAGGYFSLAKMANADLAKVATLQIHASIGMAIFTLMLLRLAIRYFTSQPEPTQNQKSGLGALRLPAHYALYVLVFIMAASGWYTGFLVSSVWVTPGTPLPENLSELPSRMIHAWTALLLFLLILLHIAAAARERVGGDKAILQRMWFGKRTG